MYCHVNWFRFSADASSAHLLNKIIGEAAVEAGFTPYQPVAVRFS
jgi:hypothetical protein